MSKRKLLLVGALSLFVGCAFGGKRRNPFDELKTVEELEQASVLLSSPFKHDRTKYGWKLMEDVPFDGKPFVPDIVEFLKPDELSVDGGILRQRAKDLNTNLGQRHAEYLENHQELLYEWRGNSYNLVFPGTVWRKLDGSFCVVFLKLVDGKWQLWSGGKFNSHDRLVILSK